MSRTEEAGVSFIGSKPCSDAICSACLLNLEERSLMRWSRKRTMTVHLKCRSTDSVSGFERCCCTRVTNGLATVIPEHSVSLQLFWKILSAYLSTFALRSLRSEQHCSMQAYPETISWFSP